MPLRDGGQVAERHATKLTGPEHSPVSHDEALSDQRSVSHTAAWVWSHIFPRGHSKNTLSCFVPVADIVLFDSDDGQNLNVSSAESQSEKNRGKKKKAVKKKTGGGVRQNLRVPVRWIYTNDQGKLSYRTGRAITWHRIRENFTVLGSDKSACSMMMVNGSLHMIDRPTFYALIAGAKRDGGLSAVRMIQSNVSIEDTIEKTNSDTSASTLNQLRCRTTYSRGYGSETKILGGAPKDSFDFEAALDGMCSEFVDALETNTGKFIDTIELEFAADRDDVLRIVNIENIRVFAETGDDRQEDSQQNSRGTFPGKPAQRSSLRRSLPGRAFPQTRSASDLPALKQRHIFKHKETKGSRGHARCNGDFCGLNVDSSTGLNILNLELEQGSITSGMERNQHSADGKFDTPSWTSELERVRASSSDKKQRATQKNIYSNESKEVSPMLHTIGQREILLARHQMHFITGAIRLTDNALHEDEDFAQAWRQLDERLQYDLGVKHPEQFYQDTQVCNSCYNVYEKLSTLRKRGFQEAEEFPSTTLEDFDKLDRSVVSSAPAKSQDVETTSANDDSILVSKGARHADGNQIEPSKKSSETSKINVKNKSALGKRSKSTHLVSSKTSGGTNSRENLQRSTALNESLEPAPSNAETEFLMRHADQLRFEQRVKVLEKERVKSSEMLSKLLLEVKSSSEEATKLRKELSSVSAQLDSERLAKSEVSDALQKTQTSLSTSQRGFTRVMQEKDEEIHRLSLEMERIRHAALAAQSQGDHSESLTAQLMEAAQTESNLLHKVDSLVRRIDDLESENKRLLSSTSQSKKDAHRDAQEQVRDELAQLKAEVEKLTKSNEERAVEVRDLKHSLESQHEKEVALRRQVSQIVNEKQKMQDHLDKAKQSLKSITSLGNSEDAAMAAVKATAEAKVRQVQNELEYVRKQAETESGFAEELRSQLSELKKQNIDLMAKQKQEMSELTIRHKEEMAERERVFERELQIPKSQINLLEEKLSTLQTNVQQMGNEMAATRRKLQVSEIDLRRAKEEALRGEDQRAELERNLAELQATLAARNPNDDAESTFDFDGSEMDLQSNITSSAGSDQLAQLQRAQNEVDYLRKQIEVETTAKTELSKAVETTRAQLRKTIEDWKTDASALQAEHRQALKIAEAEAASIREAKLDVDSELKRTQLQLSQVREGFARSKDQLQIDQKALDASSITISQLKEELAEVREKLLQETQRAEQLETEQRGEIQELQNALELSKRGREDAISDLKAKLSQAHRQVSASNAAMLELREASVLKGDDASRNTAVHIVSALLFKRRKLLLAHAFARVQQFGVYRYMKNQSLELLSNARTQHEQVLETELASLQANMAKEYEVNLARELDIVQRKHAQVVADSIEKCDTKWRNAMEEAEKSHKAHLHEQLSAQTKIHTSQLKTNQEESQAVVAKLEATHRAAFQSMLRRNEEEQEEVIRKVKEDLQREAQSTLDEVRKQHSNEVEKSKQEHCKELASMKEQFAKERDDAVACMMNSAESDCKSALQALENEMQSRLEKLQAQLEMQHSDELKKLQADSENQLKQQLEQTVKTLETKHSDELRALEESLNKFGKAEQDAIRQKAELKEHALSAEHRAEIVRIKEQYQKDIEAHQEAALAKLEEAVRRTREEERVERTTALTQSTEKWQRILQECTDQAMKDQERLTEEAAKEKTAALEKLKLETRADIAARDRAFAKEKAQFEETLRNAMGNQMEEMRKKMVAQQEQQVQAAVEAAGKREEGAILRAQAEKERALRAQRVKTAEQLEAARKEHEEDKEKALATCAREAATQIAATLNKERAEATKKFQEMKTSLLQEREASEAAILEECNRVTDQKLEEAQIQLQEAVLRCRKQCESQFGTELAQLRQERDQLMDDADAAMKSARKEIETLQKQIKKSEGSLEEAEDMAYDLQNQLESLQRAGRYMVMHNKLEQGRRLAAFCKFKQRLEADEKRRSTNADIQASEKLHRLERQLQRADARIEGLDKSRKRMHDVLVNHRKSELLQHKVETAVIQDDLKKLQSVREGLEKQRHQIMQDISQNEGQIRGVEQQLEQLSKVSAIQDGQINVTHAKRKRRLDQEFEHLLDRVAHQRKQLDNVDAKITSIQEDADTKEENLREMEAKLVEVLVEQQKLLLGELSSPASRNKD